MGCELWGLPFIHILSGRPSHDLRLIFGLLKREELDRLAAHVSVDLEMLPGGVRMVSCFAAGI